ncbi:MAG TPA: hypothetical protein VFA24_06370 [Gaiellaceae bacterium]|nr:hypothetical protein [Gaiellaceae bacterium]
MTRALVGAAVVAALLAGSSSAATPQNPLASLVLPRAQLGKVAQGLEVELLSGTTTNARAADDSFDPSDDATTLTRAGRVSGYALMYGDVGWTALRRGRGLIDVGTSLEFFRTLRQAAQYERKTLRDLARVRGQNLQGTVVERASVFPVAGLGPASIGIEIVQRIGNRRIHSTVVDFQIERILCEAVVNRADTQNVHAQVAAIARRLRDRIAAYAAGTLKARPVPLPRPLGSVQPPGKGAPDLSAMVPTNTDLKGKAGVSHQAFLPDDNAVTSYVREYRFGPSSGLFQLRAAVALQRTRREAAGRLFVLRSVFTGPEAGDTLARLVAPNAKAVRLDGTRGAKLGDESFATSVSFTSGGQRLRAVLVYERRDRVVGSVILVGKPGNLTLEGTLPYGRMLDKRMKSGLKPALVA